jgi:hypothetical protein
MVPQVVGFRSSGSFESWIWVNPDGSIELHTENNGWNMTRHGLEDRDMPILFADVELHRGRKAAEQVRAI